MTFEIGKTSTKQAPVKEDYVRIGGGHVLIGGIKFIESEVKKTSIINENATCMSGQLYEVETTFGIFKFRDFSNQPTGNDNETPSIFSGNIQYCNIAEMIGTYDKDKFNGHYKISNSYVDRLDIKNKKYEQVDVDYSMIPKINPDENDYIRFLHIK